jgi:hypothetical protein
MTPATKQLEHCFSRNDENRYELVEELLTKYFYDATTEPGYGVMEWIRRRWY